MQVNRLNFFFFHFFLIFKQFLFFSISSNKIDYGIDLSIISKNNTIELTCLNTIINDLKIKINSITPPNGLKFDVEPNPNLKG